MFLETAVHWAGFRGIRSARCRIGCCSIDDIVLLRRRQSAERPIQSVVNETLLRIVGRFHEIFQFREKRLPVVENDLLATYLNYKAVQDWANYNGSFHYYDYCVFALALCG
jgi:hypothetical protein